MPLSPPQRIQGRMNQHTDPALRAERDAWVAKARNDGHTLAAIADAIDLNISTIACITKETGAKRPMKDVMKRVYRYGVYVGAITVAINAMPEAVKIALYNKAAKTGKTMSQVLADHYVESLTKGEPHEKEIR